MSRREACFICRKLAGREPQPPGGYLLRTRHFALGHGPSRLSTPGTLLVESTRHFLDFGEMAPREGADLAAVLRRAVRAVKSGFAAERVYAVALMDGCPHFHLWLVPKPRGATVQGLRYLARPHPPLSEAAATAAAARVRRALVPGPAARRPRSRPAERATSTLVRPGRAHRGPEGR